MNEGLLKFTDDELRAELKRRAVERRRGTPREITYVEFDATISKIYNVAYTYPDGRAKYLPFPQWRYCVDKCTSDLASQYLYKEYQLQSGAFKKCESPRLGDRVKLRYRRTKAHEVSDLSCAKIIEILKRRK